MPAVSIVTPAWNAAPHLRETLDSVLAQTFTDWELLVVDDGSTDGTPEIVRQYAARDPRVRLIHQANSGPSRARNRAMAEARGELFVFLDSDDVWQPGFLDAQLRVLDASPDADLVTTTAINRGGPFAGQPTRRPVSGHPELTLSQLLLDETSIFIMTLFRRRVFETIGGFDEAQWTSEDYDFWIRAAQHGFRFRVNPAPLAWYRVRSESLSRQRARMLDGIVHSYRKALGRTTADDEIRAILTAQIDRFERELLLERAKVAIEAGDYAAAVVHLDALRARGAGALVALTAWLARYLPPLASLAYRLRGWRPRFFSTVTVPTTDGHQVPQP